MSSADRRLATPAPALALLRGSGLDTSSGTDFIQDRIGLFAAITTCVGGAFLIFSLVLRAETVQLSLADKLLNPGGIGHIVAVAIAGSLWFVTRGRGRPLPLVALGALDALGLIVVCGMWAFRADPARIETVYTAILAVTETVLVRSILVPSKAGRTLRLVITAHLPLSLAVWLRLDTIRPFTAVGQVLWAVATITIATITSRIIYDLRRSVREAHELGPYRLEERLGAGGMGEVWRARHRLLVRDAAVKLIRPELLASGVDVHLLLRRFEREARATAALRSPHTVQLYDFGQADDGTLFYVMEMLTGIDLEKLVDRFGPLPAERAIHLLKQVCDSLAEAHRNGLTHRDIKPANLFVSGAGTELDFVKVLDFGLVRLTRDQPSGEALKLTAGNTVAGCTPAYAAPEIILGDAGYDHRVDIYALGCVGYWLVTGKLVFEGATPMKVMLAHAHEMPARPQTRTELKIPEELEQIVMDCLEKDPARRPASAVELAHRLARAPVAQPWTDERADRWWRAHLPEKLNEPAVADVLLEHEGGPLTLRRAPRI